MNGLVLGVDVSMYQPTDDWAAVAGSGVQRAYCKATEGATWQDPTYFRHMNGARNAGLRVGPYHFWRPNDDAVLQAQWFQKIAGWNAEWLEPMLDLEVLPGACADPDGAARAKSVALVLAAVNTWLEAIGAWCGKPVTIYTNPSTWRALGAPTNYRQHKLWVADYGVPAPPDIGWGPDGWTGWQYTDAGSVPGIAGGVDLTHWKN